MPSRSRSSLTSVGSSSASSDGRARALERMLSVVSGRMERERRASAILPGHPRVVQREWFRRAHRRPGRRVGRDLPRQARARRRADRLGQDALGVPLGDRPAHGRTAQAEPGTRVLYISPLKALGVDVERNLRSPLVGIGQSARRLGARRARRHGRGPLRRHHLSRPAQARAPTPPDILITTPESLYLMLTSQAGETSGVHTVIVDEVHAVAATKRGAHLAVEPRAARRLLLETTGPAHRPVGDGAADRRGRPVPRRLGARSRSSRRGRPRRSTCGRRAGRRHVPTLAGSHRRSRHAARVRRAGASSAETPSATGSIWPHVEEAIVDRILQHRSTIVFSNSRRLAERLTGRLNEIYAERSGARRMLPMPAQVPVPADDGAGRQISRRRRDPVLAQAHHGSVSKEQRAAVEDELKSGSPALRRRHQQPRTRHRHGCGRPRDPGRGAAERGDRSAAHRPRRHQVGEVAARRCSPSTAATCCTPRSHRAHAGGADRGDRRAAESARHPRPADRRGVRPRPGRRRGLVRDGQAQRAVPHAAALGVRGDARPAGGPLPVRRVRRAAAPARLGPRRGHAHRAARRAAHRGHERRHHPRPRAVRRLHRRRGEPAGRRVGELDEEMVYESRVNDVFTLGTTSWRIAGDHPRSRERHARVRAAGRLPFWHGDGLGRPAELGEASASSRARCRRRAETEAASGCASRARRRGRRPICSPILAEQREATGHLPTDRSLTVERGRDEVGDWRVILHSPYGMQVHAPWALAVNARIRERLGVEGSAVASDDGIIVRVPDAPAEPPGRRAVRLRPRRARADRHRRGRRVGAVRLALPRVRGPGAAAAAPQPGQARSPLWQQRQRSAQLLEVARRYPTFPIILETAPRGAAGRLRRARAAAHRPRASASAASGWSRRRPTRRRPSPATCCSATSARSCTRATRPLAERRAAALSVDPALLAELLGKVEMRELLDPEVIAQFERELQRLDPSGGRAARGRRRPAADAGAADAAEVARAAGAGRRPRDDATDAHLDELLARRARSRVTIAGVCRSRRSRTPGACAMRSAWRCPSASRPRSSSPSPIRSATSSPGSRARTAVHHRGGRRAARRRHRRRPAHAQRLEEQRRRDREASSSPRRASTATRPSGATPRCCAGCAGGRSRRCRQSRAGPPAAFARFLPEWQHVGGRSAASTASRPSSSSSRACRIPASAWESLDAAGRVCATTAPRMLDELTATGEVSVVGPRRAPRGRRLDRACTPPSRTAHAAHSPPTDEPNAAAARSCSLALGGGGAFFSGSSPRPTDAENEPRGRGAVELTWAGRVTNDTFAPRAHAPRRRPQAHRTQRAAPRRPAVPRARACRGRCQPIAASTADARRPLVAAAGARGRCDRPARGGHALVDCSTATASSRAARCEPRASGGFALAYRDPAGFEQAGHCRRGYVIEKLGAAQFAASATVDRLRDVRRSDPTDRRHAAARDASPSPRPTPRTPTGPRWPGPRSKGGPHRPGRKAGGLVVLVDGALALYLERGGKTLLAFTDDEAVLAAAAASVADLVRRGRLDTLTVEQVNGAFVRHGRRRALRDAGFVESPRGLEDSACLRATPSTARRSGSTSARGSRGAPCDLRVPAFATGDLTGAQ